MHPYRMQQLIKERGKDQVINVQRRASLYQTIKQLRRAGLITVRETSREEKHPERTIYELTEHGLRTAREWMRDMLSTPAREFPEFPAAISLLPLLSPADVLCQLEKREAVLADKLARIDSELHQEGGVLPRLFLLEMEYLHAVVEAELKWVRSLVEDLRSERITWSEEWLRRFMSPETESDTER
jgi:DNA-binding PadR family transcriptional regulator